MPLPFPSLLGLPAVLAVTVGTAAALYASPVLAQTRAALVQSVDEPGRNPYQEAQSNVNCRGSTVCNWNFANVPAGKRLVVTNIAGYVDTAAGTLPNCFLSSGFGGPGFVSLPFTGVRGPNTALGGRIFMTHSVLAYFGPGEPVNAFCQAGFGDTMSGGAQVMLSGYYVNLP